MFAWICSFIIYIIEHVFLYYPPGDDTFYDNTVQRAILASGKAVAHTICYRGEYIERIPRDVPIVVFFHGNGTSLHGCVPCIQQLSAKLSVVFVAMEYANYVRGVKLFASNTSETETENMLEEAVDFCSMIHAEYDSSPFFLMGHSLGTGVAIHVASSAELHFAVNGVILVSPYLSIISVVNHTLAKCLPFIDVLPSYRRISTMVCPMIAFGGTGGTLIAPWHSTRLFELQKKKDSTHLIADADHNGIMVPKHLAFLASKIACFLSARSAS